jgi:hypothetical protein
MRIDYIFASLTMSPRLSAAGVLIPEASVEASPHFPVWAEFEQALQHVVAMQWLPPVLLSGQLTHVLYGWVDPGIRYD